MAQAAQQLLERWGARSEAVAQLNAVIDSVSGPSVSQTSPSRCQEGVSASSVQLNVALGCLSEQLLLSQVHKIAVDNARSKFVIP